MSVVVVTGAQRGDEGKGRVVDYLAKQNDIVARFNGGPNAGHTVVTQDEKILRLHQIPSGIAYPDKLNIIGNGALLDPLRLLKEIDDLESVGIDITPKVLAISDMAHLILPHHISLDEVREAGNDGQGSTKRGIAFAARDKYERIGARTELIIDDPAELTHKVIAGLDLANQARKKVGLPLHKSKAEALIWVKKASKLAPYITDTVSLLHNQIQKGKTVLAEGAQAFDLDIEHGMYPYVTSSHTTTGGALNGLGLSAKSIKEVIGVVKLTKSHVGGGPFVTEITDNPKLTEQIRGPKGKNDSEYGASTGRARRIGYLDLPEIRQAILVNGITKLALTKLDCAERYGTSMLIATGYKYNGKVVQKAPSSARRLERCEPQYKKVPIWKNDISGIKTFDQLPKEAKDLINFLEKQLECPIKMIGVGPHRNQLIIR
jgi:adenylosuccinate synthase